MKLTLALGSGTLLTMVGCGDDDEVGPDAGRRMVDSGSLDSRAAEPDALVGDLDAGDDGGSSPTCGAGGELGSISANHGHQFRIPQEDIDAAIEKTYNIGGLSMGGHPHMVIITAADFTTLSMGGEVVVESSRDANHSHMVTIACG